MAYLEKFEVHSSQVDLSTTGDKFRWGPTFDNFVVTGAAITLNAAASAGSIQVAHRPTYGSDTGRTTHATVTVPSGAAAGRVIATTFTTPRVVSAGQEIVIAVGTAIAGNTAAKVSFYGYYDHDTLRNQANVTVV